MKKNQIITFFWCCVTICWATVMAVADDEPFIAKQSKTVEGELEQVSCYQLPGYLVIEKRHMDGSGTDFLVKFKVDESAKLTCSYSVEKNDFEIKNEWAAYFWTIKKDLMFLQHYTGPSPFLFSVWDLKKRQKVFESICDDPEFLDGSMGYWLETGDANKENCPEFQDWEDHGLGGAIETWVILDLTNFNISETDETRCSPRQ